MTSRAWLPLVLLAALGQSPAARAESELTPQEVFEKRLLPIFKSPNPSSCVQCHLAGVELKNYILPSHEKTFVSLRDQGLIDMEKPARSRILALIRMGEGEGSLIQQKTRQAEFEAFRDWVERSARDPRLARLPKLSPEELGKPARPVEVIRHARTDRLAATFANTIWPMRFRCMGCHTEGTAENAKLAREHGARVAWFRKGGPEATLAYLRASKLIDVERPERSLLLRKPLGEVKHGGGKKFQVGDQGYKAFRAFLEDYARISKDSYTDKKDLPDPDTSTLRFGSDVWLKLNETPPAWADRLVEVRLFAWDREKKDWESQPIATSDRVVWGKGKLWQHNLTLLADPKSERAGRWQKDGKPSLPKGRYLVRVYLDGESKLSRDWRSGLGPDALAGQAELESAWPEGYGRMTILEASRVRKPASAP